MPRVLKDPPTHICRQSRIQQPVPIPYVVLYWPIPDPLSGHGELAAAGYSHNVRDRYAGKELHELVWKLHRSWMVGVVWPFPEISCRLELGRASNDPCAAKIHIPGGLDEVEVQVVERDNGVWVVS